MSSLWLGLSDHGIFASSSWETEMGILLWTFILIGNAAGIIVLSEVTKGGTSAMG